MLHTVLYVIVFLLALVFSNVLNRVFPRLPLPVIQVAIGLVMGVLGAEQVLHVEPEIFLAFIIAPLLFRESEETDVKRIFKHTKLILILVFPLVFITALGLGYLTNWLYLSVPLAAAFALGASLAPTDAVTVTALSDRFSFPRRITSILKGEGLLNDASGIIALQMAILALSTGHFSVEEASFSLVISTIGGAAIGFVIVWIKNLALTILEDVAAQDVSGYLMLELLIPLAAFLVADLWHVSGIIAVVVAGVMQANGLRRTTLFDAQVTKVKNTLWDTLSFILNALVFMFLGIELYQLISPLIKHRSYSNSYLLLMVLVLTIALFAIRFLVLITTYRVISLRRGKSLASYWNDIMLLTFSGSKGTIGIAAILLIPRTEASQPLLVFLCAAVTGLSFLASILLVPLFTVEKSQKINNVTRIAILNDVIAGLNEDAQRAKDATGYTITVDSYQERIQRLIIEQESSSTSRDFNDLQLMIMRVESEGLEDALRRKRISMYTYRTYQRYLKSLEQTVVHHLVSSLQFAAAVATRAFHLLFSNLSYVSTPHSRTDESIQRTHDEITQLYFKNTELVLDALENLEGIYDEHLIDFLQSERIRTASFVAAGGHITRMMNKAHPHNLTEMMRGYYLERKLIFEYEARGELTSREAKIMRQNVNVLEDYSMSGEKPSLLVDFLEYRKK